MPNDSRYLLGVNRIIPFLIKLSFNDIMVEVTGKSRRITCEYRLLVALPRFKWAISIRGNMQKEKLERKEEMIKLRLDHIHGGGTQQKKELGLNNPHKYYKYLAEMDIPELRSNYQILCANCNWIKRTENNEH